MTIYNFYTIRELAPQQHECFPDMNFGYNSGRVKNRIYLPDTFVGATYYFDGEFSNRYGTSQIDDDGHPYIDINFNDGEIGNGTVFIIAGKRYCTFPYTLEYVNVFETEIDASEIDTSNLVTKQTFDNTVERIDSDITTGDTANRTAIDQLTAATNQRFADVNTKLSGYDDQIGAVDTEVKNLASEVDGYSTDIAKAVADAADAKSVAESAADDAATASAEAGEAKDAVSNLGARVTQVETDVETAETVANQAKSTADAAAQTASTAQSAASAAQTAAGQAQTSADVAKTAADNAQSVADEAKQAAQAIAGEIATVKDQISTIQQKDTEQDRKIGTLETTTAGTTETVNTLQENFNNLNDSVGNLGTAVMTNTRGLSSINDRISGPAKSVIGFESGSPALLSPYTLGETVALTPDQIESFGFGANAPRKLGWSEFSIKPVIKPPTATGDRSYIVVSVTFNQDVAGGFPEATLSAVLSGTFMGDEMVVWRYFHEIGLFVPYFKSSLIAGGLDSAGIYPRVMTGVISGNMYTRPNFSQQVSTIHISTRASDNLSFNGGFALNRYNVPPYFTGEG